MKVGEALTLRSELQKRIAQVQGRLEIWVQEGEEPAEHPTAVLNEMRSMTDELLELITSINLTNAQTTLDGTGEGKGITITQALARRDVLATRAGVLRNAARDAAQSRRRYSQAEIRETRLLDAKELQSEVDAISREIRDLDTRIQQHNWTTELIELAK